MCSEIEVIEQISDTAVMEPPFTHAVGTGSGPVGVCQGVCDVRRPKEWSSITDTHTHTHIHTHTHKHTHTLNAPRSGSP
jgi:hypothetical protein